MYIIHKHEDFYDFYSNIYGIDKKVVFDRREEKALKDIDLANMSFRYSKTSFSSSTESFILLEVGNVQHLFKLFDFIIEDDMVKDYSVSLIKTFKENKHFFEAPLSITGVHLSTTWSWRKGSRYLLEECFKRAIDHTFHKVDLPVISNTKLTALLNPEEIWIELQNYISSLSNDEDVDLKMTDVEKAVNHGFDKKTSFRNPIK